MNNGIFVISELTGSVRDQVATIQREFDPRMAGEMAPHITLVGSSGVGPMPLDTSAKLIKEVLDPVAAKTEPILVLFGRPIQFMQTNIVVLPLDPHGPLRTLHERIAASGLRFARARFRYAPHCTLSFYPTLTPEQKRRLLGFRIEEPFLIDHLQFVSTINPQPGRKLLEIRLGTADDTLKGLESRPHT
ncbi:MAG: 2'-5' RNA ligase family protein [Gemmatimonadaceae bacterium]